MFHHALILKLRPGKLEEYRKAHNNLWPSIAKSMEANGVSMSIHHDKGLLFVFATAPDEQAWDESRQCPALEEWNQAMTQFLETDHEGNMAVVEPTEVFAFGIFADKP